MILGGVAMETKYKVDMVKFNGIQNPVLVRPDTTDVGTARTILERLCYDFSKMWELRYFPDSYLNNFKPQFIIDGGANAGYASIFFATKYPDAKKILAIEPDAENFEMLQCNTQHYPNVEPIHGALWNRETDLSIGHGEIHKGTDAFMTSEVEMPAPPPEKISETTRGITIGKILRESGFKYIDILKLDIEGAEKEIFSEEGNYQEWLPFVKVLIIELHDRMKRDCSHNFFRAVSWYKSFFVHSGENLIFIREDLL